MGADKQKDGIGAWLPEPAQRIIKRHMGTANSPCTVQDALQACDLPGEAAVVDNADVAGGTVAYKPYDPQLQNLIKPVACDPQLPAADKPYRTFASKVDKPDVTADDAAAGDAAVLALVTSTRAPAVGQLMGSPTGGQPQGSPTSSTGSSGQANGRAQFFNLWEADPDSEEAEKVNQWLRKLGLGRYFEQLASEGFDDMNILANLEEEQIREIMEMCPMPMLHEQQLRRGLARLRSDCTLPDVPQVAAMV